MGNIGRRYLQAISKLSVDYKLFCYDKSQEALNYIPKFCEDNNINTSNINTVNKDNDLYNSINSETLVLIATTAKDRKEILDICIEKMPLTIIAEKPLVQNLSDYNYIMKKNEVLSMPIAHRQGNYFASSELVEKLKSNNQIAFKYKYENPNGSVSDIAGILNEEKNVLGMMPHPERASDLILGSNSGYKIFQSILES